MGETMRNDVGGGDGGGTTYDEQIANPNEPTYCLCQRVSFDKWSGATTRIVRSRGFTFSASG